MARELWRTGANVRKCKNSFARRPIHPRLLAARARSTPPSHQQMSESQPESVPPEEDGDAMRTPAESPLPDDDEVWRMLRP